MIDGTGLPAGAGWKIEACAFASLAASNLETAWTQVRWSLQYLLSSLGSFRLNYVIRRMLFPVVMLREVRKAFKSPKLDFGKKQQHP